MKNTQIEEILLAGALGDAFGYAIEFYNVKKIKIIYGEDGLVDYPIKNNQLYVSDDTQMTLFCQQACLSYLNISSFDEDLKEKLIQDINQAYGDWYLTQTEKYNSLNSDSIMSFEELWSLRAPGNTCLSALAKGGNGGITMLSKINDSKGCGGIMRVAPIAFLNTDLETIFELGVKQAALTHGHPDGYLPSGYFSVILKLIADGIEPVESLNIANNILKKYKYHENFLAQIEHLTQCLNNENTYYADELNHLLGEGWVGDEAFTVAFYCFAKANDFEDCLILSSNHNGDSDSTATLAAQLYAAKFGLSNEAKEHVQYLDVLPIIKHLNNELFLESKNTIKMKN
jgi:ADP-ribosyl-[dinitrogen reductase] hydrolase